MHKRQKNILTDFITIIIITAIAVVAMIEFKNWVSRSEAMRAMQHLSTIVAEYRKAHGSIPPESYVNSIKEDLEGHVRIGNLQYRARWIDFESSPDEILAYVERNYRSLYLGHGFVVLRMDGSVTWMNKQEFETLFARQRKPMEVQTPLK